MICLCLGQTEIESSTFVVMLNIIGLSTYRFYTPKRSANVRYLFFSNLYFCTRLPKASYIHNLTKGWHNRTITCMEWNLFSILFGVMKMECILRCWKICVRVCCRKLKFTYFVIESKIRQPRDRVQQGTRNNPTCLCVWLQIFKHALCLDPFCTGCAHKWRTHISHGRLMIILSLGC